MTGVQTCALPIWLYGKGSSGSGGSSAVGGGGGSSGGAGYNGAQACISCSIYLVGGNGGLYGGGAGAGNIGTCIPRGTGAVGAVRIVWPGNTRKFPSTCVGTP